MLNGQSLNHLSLQNRQKIIRDRRRYQAFKTIPGRLELADRWDGDNVEDDEVNLKEDTGDMDNDTLGRAAFNGLRIPTVSPPLPEPPFKIPPALLHGVPMIKVTKQKIKQRVFRLVPELITSDWLPSELRITPPPPPSIQWESRKIGQVRLDQIREVRYGSITGWTGGGGELPQGLGPASAGRRITIVYVTTMLLPSDKPSPNGFVASVAGGLSSTSNSTWKTLNMIALTDQVFQLWITTLSKILKEFRQVIITKVTPDGAPTRSAGETGGHVLGIMGPKDTDSTAMGGGVSALDDGLSVSGLSVPDEAVKTKKVTYEEVIRMCRKIGLVAKNVPAVERCFKVSTYSSCLSVTYVRE